MLISIRTMNHMLNNVNWINDMRLLTVDESWEHFSRTFTNIMNTCIPQSKPRIYKNIYITHDAIHLKNVKNKLWKRYTRTRLPSDHKAFCTARNELRSYTRLLRHNFELGITNDIKLNPKKFWQYVKSRLNTSVTINDIRNDNNDLVTNDYDKAELFNSYFCSVFTDEDSHSLPPSGSLILLLLLILLILV